MIFVSVRVGEALALGRSLGLRVNSCFTINFPAQRLRPPVASVSLVQAGAR